MRRIACALRNIIAILRGFSLDVFRLSMTVIGAKSNNRRNT